MVVCIYSNVYPGIVTVNSDMHPMELTPNEGMVALSMEVDVCLDVASLSSGA